VAIGVQWYEFLVMRYVAVVFAILVCFQVVDIEALDKPPASDIVTVVEQLCHVTSKFLPLL
jgi:hypothetical protein